MVHYEIDTFMNNGCKLGRTEDLPEGEIDDLP